MGLSDNVLTNSVNYVSSPQFKDDLVELTYDGSSTVDYVNDLNSSDPFVMILSLGGLAAIGIGTNLVSSKIRLMNNLSESEKKYIDEFADERKAYLEGRGKSVEKTNSWKNTFKNYFKRF